MTTRWHSAGTFDVATKTGGPFGTIRDPAELAHLANTGLDIAVRLLAPIKEEVPILSYADFYQVRFFVYIFFSNSSFALVFLSPTGGHFFVHYFPRAVGWGGRRRGLRRT